MVWYGAVPEVIEGKLWDVWGQQRCDLILWQRDIP